MADIPRSSFIPKESTSSIPARVRRRRVFSLFNILGIFMLLCSVGLAGGVLFYEQTLNESLEDVKQKLLDQENLFKDEDVQRVRAFHQRIEAASYLLDRHIATSKLFRALEAATMSRVQFLSLTLKYDHGLGVDLTLEGGTEEFKTVALQAIQFGGNGVLKNSIFKSIGTSNVSIAETKTVPSDSVESHEVVFTVAGTLPYAVFTYDGENPGPSTPLLNGGPQQMFGGTGNPTNQ